MASNEDKVTLNDVNGGPVDGVSPRDTYVTSVARALDAQLLGKDGTSSTWTVPSDVDPTKTVTLTVSRG